MCGRARYEMRGDLTLAGLVTGEGDEAEEAEGHEGEHDGAAEGERARGGCKRVATEAVEDEKV